jgi:hypothetical protein
MCILLLLLLVALERPCKLGGVEAEGPCNGGVDNFQHFVRFFEVELFDRRLERIRRRPRDRDGGGGAANPEHTHTQTQSSGAR